MQAFGVDELCAPGTAAGQFKFSSRHVVEAKCAGFQHDFAPTNPGLNLSKRLSRIPNLLFAVKQGW